MPRVIIIGEMHVVDSGAHPEHPWVPPGQPPLGIWGPTDPRPSPPIANVPGAPGYQPPTGTPPGGAHPSHPIYFPDAHPEQPIYLPPRIWGGGNEPFPTPPIYLPPKPTTPPPSGEVKPPPPDGGWGYHPEYGWGYFPPSSEPSPKTPVAPTPTAPPAPKR